ncbi:MAG: HAD family hydrolase [Bacteroidia bacterium]
MESLEIPKGIKNIIFDLGGVIFDVDYHRTSQAFKDLGCSNFDELYSQQKQSGLFNELETGNISTQAFVNELLRILPKGITPKQIINAWNAMLIGVPQIRLNKLLEHKQNYRTFLLSNTNAIHEDAFTKMIVEKNKIDSFAPFFEQLYFSHRIGLRKPNKEIFEFVLEQNNLLPEETLFIDDSPQHLIGAEKTSIKTVLWT